MSAPAGKQNLLVVVLSVIALAAILAAYFSPIWWVSLTAPNYPKEAFPDGIRIHFHFDNVYNGCKVGAGTGRLESETLQQDLGEGTERYNPVLERDKDINKGAQGLDCVHEMNTINHYVGMFPIATGAPVEKPLAKFFFGFFTVMIIAFMIPRRKARVATLAIGFLGVAAWMIVDQFVMGRLDEHIAFYVKEAGSFFNEPDRIRGWGENVRTISQIVIAVMIVGMGLIVAATAKWPRFTLLLALVPALLPVFFVVTYSGWLWFFGHNLHPWGAFTVKPFMPTVFGEGKVAQFSTYSYPYYGYALLVVGMVCLLLALLIRRQAMRSGAAE